MSCQQPPASSLTSKKSPFTHYARTVLLNPSPTLNHASPASSSGYGSPVFAAYDPPYTPAQHITHVLTEPLRTHNHAPLKVSAPIWTPAHSMSPGPNTLALSTPPIGDARFGDTASPRPNLGNALGLRGYKALAYDLLQPPDGRTLESLLQPSPQAPLFFSPSGSTGWPPVDSNQLPAPNLPVASPWTFCSSLPLFSFASLHDNPTYQQIHINGVYCPHSPLAESFHFPSPLASIIKEEPCSDPLHLVHNAPQGSPPALLSSTSPKPECPQTPPGNSSPNESVSAVIATRLNRWHAAELLAMWNTNPVIPSPEVRSGWAREKGLKARQVYTWFKSHETRSPDARVAYAKSVFKWVKQAEASEESIRLEPELEIVPHLWYLPVSNAHDEPPPPTTNIYDPFCCVEWNSPHPDAQTAEFTYDILSSELPVQNETVDSSPSPYHPESWVNDDSGGNRGFEMPMRLLPLRETGSGAGIEGRGWRSERLQTFNRLMELNKELGL